MTVFSNIHVGSTDSDVYKILQAEKAKTNYSVTGESLAGPLGVVMHYYQDDYGNKVEMKSSNEVIETVKFTN